METLKLDRVLKDSSLRRRVVSGIVSGKVLVYPTDTIYGIGCSAEKPESVERIRKAKGRDGDKPFSVIAPSKEWIWEHSSISKVNRNLADKLLPGPYTLVLAANGRSPKSVVSHEKSLGIRIPRHPFTDIVREAGVPFVTTSVNISGDPPVKNIKDIPEEMKSHIDMVIDDGNLEGHASRIFDMRTEEVRVLRRRTFTRRLPA